MTRALATPLALALALAPGLAAAGNDEGVLFGTEATLTGGAVTATVSEGSALWYNPAGVASVGNNRLDVSGSAFVLRLHRVPEFVRVAGAATAADITEFVSIPAAATYVRRLGARAHLAAGVFVPEHSDWSLEQSFTGPMGSRWVVSDAGIEDDTHAGVGVGVEVTPTLRLGASLFGAYRSASGSSQALGGLASAGMVDDFETLSSLYSYRAVSFEAGLGVQWSPTSSLRVGASLRSPGLQVYEAWRVTGIATAAQGGATPQARFSPVVSAGSEWRAAWTTPLRVRGGVAWTGERLSVALDGDVALGLTPDHGNPREFNWNLRLGGRYRVREQLCFGAGVFTDRSPYRAANVEGPRSLDFYGVTAGVEFGNTLTVTGGPAPALTFGTTLGLRYAYGTGDIDTTAIDAANNATAATGAITVHEVGVTLGSTLRF